MDKELILRELYYSPKTGYRSAKHLYDLAIQEDPSITLSFTKTWLEKQEAYSKYKKYNNPAHFRKTLVRHLGEQVQMDLFLLTKYKDQNDQYNIIFMFIEVLSRYAFAIPLKGKTSKDIIPALKIFLERFKERFHDMPKLVQFDEGPEFINKDVTHFFEEHSIHPFNTYSKRKAAIVERLNRTIKEKIEKLHTATGNHNWIDHLQDIIENYNTQHHRSIGMSPSEVNYSNQYLVWGRLFGHVVEHIKKPRYEVGDKVRVLDFQPHGKEFTKYFKKKYPPEINPKTGKVRRINLIKSKHIPPFSEEIFQIDKVLMGDPVVYKLYSPEAEMEILGKFYESELSLVR